MIYHKVTVETEKGAFELMFVNILWAGKFALEAEKMGYKIVSRDVVAFAVYASTRRPLANLSDFAAPPK